MEQLSNRPVCDAHETIYRGWRKRQNDKGHIVYCKCCKHYFTENPKYRKTNINAQQLVEKFMQRKSVRELAKELSMSKSSAWRRLAEGFKEVPTWQETTSAWLQEYQALESEWFKNLVVDTTPLKVEGEKLTYLHAADCYTGLPLIYKIMDTPYEKEEFISHELQELRDLGYWPDVATIDGSMALYSALRNVYGFLPIQFCIIHLYRNLKKNLKVDDQFSLIRFGAKNLILHAAASDFETRETMLERLRYLIDSCHDDVTIKAVKGFLSNIDNYKTIEELKGHPEALTTNTCENNIRWIKVNLKHRLFGFKSRETAQKHIDLHWKEYVSRHLKGLPSRNLKSLSFMLDGHVPLEKLATLIKGITYEDLIRMMKKRIIVRTIKGRYPISLKQINRILTLSSRVDNVGELADVMALDPTVIESIIRLYGEKSFDHKIKVERVGHVNLDLYLDKKKLDQIFRSLRIIHESEIVTS